MMSNIYLPPPLSASWASLMIRAGIRYFFDTGRYSVLENGSFGFSIYLPKTGHSASVFRYLGKKIDMYFLKL